MKIRFALQSPLVIPLSGFAQLKPEQTLNRRAIADVHFSPDGTLVAFTVSEPVKGTTRNRHIWTYELTSKHLRQITNSAKSEFNPRWSPDGRTLAFLSDRDEGTQIYLIAIDGGEGKRLTEGKNSVRSFEWSPDGSQIAFLAPEPKTDARKRRRKTKMMRASGQGRYERGSG